MSMVGIGSGGVTVSSGMWRRSSSNSSSRCGGRYRRMSGITGGVVVEIRNNGRSTMSSKHCEVICVNLK